MKVSVFLQVEIEKPHSCKMKDLDTGKGLYEWETEQVDRVM